MNQATSVFSSTAVEDDRRSKMLAAAEKRRSETADRGLKDPAGYRKKVLEFERLKKELEVEEAKFEFKARKGFPTSKFPAADGSDGGAMAKTRRMKEMQELIGSGLDSEASGKNAHHGGGGGGDSNELVKNNEVGGDDGKCEDKPRQDDNDAAVQKAIYESLEESRIHGLGTNDDEVASDHARAVSAALLKRGLSIGAPCRAMYEGEEYEATIKRFEMTPDQRVRAYVEYEGYGNVESVCVGDLKPSLGEAAIVAQRLEAEDDGADVVVEDEDETSAVEADRDAAKIVWSKSDNCRVLVMDAEEDEGDGDEYEAEVNAVEVDAAGAHYCVVTLVGYGDELTVWPKDMRPSAGDEARRLQAKEASGLEELEAAELEAGEFDPAGNHCTGQICYCGACTAPACRPAAAEEADAEDEDGEDEERRAGEEDERRAGEDDNERRAGEDDGGTEADGGQAQISMTEPGAVAKDDEQPLSSNVGDLCLTKAVVEGRGVGGVSRLPDDGTPPPLHNRASVKTLTKAAADSGADDDTGPAAGNEPMQKLEAIAGDERDDSRPCEDFGAADQKSSGGQLFKAQETVNKVASDAKESDGLLGKVEMLETKLGRRSKKITELEEQIAKLKNKTAFLNATQDAFKSQGVIAVDKGKIKSMEEANKAKNEALDKETARIETTTEKNEAKIEILKKEKIRINAMEESNRLKMQYLESENEEIKLMEAQLKSAPEVKAKMQAVEDEIEKLHTKEEYLKAKHAALENDKATIKAMEEENKSKIKSLGRQQTAQEREKKSEEKEVQVIELQGTLQDCKKELEIAQLENTVLKRRSIEFREDNVKKLEQLQKDYSESQLKIKTLECDLENRTREKKMLLQNVKVAEEEKQKLQTNTEVNEKLNQQIEENGDKVIEMQRELQKHEKELKIAQQAWKAEKQEKTELQRRAKEYSNVTEQMKKLEKDHSELQYKLIAKKLEGTMDNGKDKCKELEIKCNELKTRYRGLENRYIHDTKKLIDKVEALTKENQILKHSLGKSNTKKFEQRPKIGDIPPLPRIPNYQPVVYYLPADVDAVDVTKHGGQEQKKSATAVEFACADADAEAEFRSRVDDEADHHGLEMAAAPAVNAALPRDAGHKYGAIVTAENNGRNSGRVPLRRPRTSGFPHGQAAAAAKNDAKAAAEEPPPTPGKLSRGETEAAAEPPTTTGQAQN